MDRIQQDLQFALRQLRRNAGFTAIVIATLAIGIGANTTIFSAVYELLLRPLPFVQSEQLVSMSGSIVGRGDDWSISYPNAADIRELNRAFSDVAWFQNANYSLVGGDRPERISALRASWSVFSTLLATPQIGRTYTETEDSPDGENVSVISHGLWQSHFGGEPDVVGRTIVLSGTQYTVIGVMPPKFSFPGPGTDLYVPLRASKATWNRPNGGLSVIGRMNPGLDLAAVRSDLQRVSRQLQEDYPAVNKDWSAFSRPLRDWIYPQNLSFTLYTLLGAVALVLLIACVNVANLLLARATGREREIAVRSAIGAGRSRVIGQLLTESLVLALAGGILGVLLAVWGTQALASAIPEGVSFSTDFRLNAPVLGFAVLLSVLTGIAFGLAPALAASRTDLSALLVGRAGHQTRRRGQRRNLLVVSEVALALMLLVGAGLMVRSFASLVRTSPGFDPTGLVTLRVGVDATYEGPDARRDYQHRVVDAVRAAPGVHAAAAVDWLPLGGNSNFTNFNLEGREGQENAGQVFVTDGYFSAMGIPLDLGRDFNSRDVAGAPPVAIASRAFVDKYFPDQDALVKRVHFSFDPPNVWREIVGVTGSVRHGGLDDDPRPELYLPFAQLPWAPNTYAIVARVAGAPERSIEAVRNAVWSVDPNQMLYDVQTAQRIISESSRVLIGRIIAIALGLFGLVALTLAALGLYGVISYGVAQRTYEIGVRAALGADRGHVLRMILNQGMRMVAAGLLIGLAGALVLSRIMESLLFGVTARDPITFIAVPLLLLAVAAIASGVPALRAARIDPVIALQAE